MSFHFYTDAISRGTRAIAAGIFITGLVLVGFGFMIYLLPRFFATLAAVVFFVAGIGCVVTATKIFLVRRKIERSNSDGSQGYRKNVRIHIEDDFET